MDNHEKKALKYKHIIQKNNKPHLLFSIRDNYSIAKIGHATQRYRIESYQKMPLLSQKLQI